MKHADTPFWQTKRLDEMSSSEWEALCDGCGLCCLHKLEDVDTGEVHYTDVACRELDIERCRCRSYAERHERVADCVRLDPSNLDALEWMPPSCAYRRLWRGDPLPAWHPLVTGDRDSVHAAHRSIRGRAVSEVTVSLDELEARLVDWHDARGTR